MNTFSKILLVGLLSLAALFFVPTLAGPACGGLGALIGAFFLLVLGLFLALVLGGAALIGVLIAVLVVVAILSPIWVPALLVVGFVSLLVRLTRGPKPTPPAA